MPIVARAVPRMLAQQDIHKQHLLQLVEQPVMYVRSVKPVHTLLRVQQAVRSVRQVNIPAVPVKVLARLVLRVHIIAARVTPDVQLARRVITARAAAQEPDVRQENTVMQPEVRQKRIVLLVQPEPIPAVQVTRVVLTAVRAITAQADLTERLVAQVHILQPPMQRRLRLVRHVQRVRIITAPVKALVRIVQQVHTRLPEQALVLLVRPERIRLPDQVLVRHVRTNRLHGSTAIAAERRNVLRRVMRKPVRGRQALGATALRTNAVQVNTVPTPAQVLAQVVRPIRIKAVPHTTIRPVRIAARISGLTQEKVLVRSVPQLMLPAIYGT